MVEQRRDAAEQVTGRGTRRRRCHVNGVVWHVVGRGTGGQRRGQGGVEAVPGMGGGDGLGPADESGARGRRAAATRPGRGRVSRWTASASWVSSKAAETAEAQAIEDPSRSRCCRRRSRPAASSRSPARLRACIARASATSADRSHRPEMARTSQPAGLCSRSTATASTASRTSSAGCSVTSPAATDGATPAAVSRVTSRGLSASSRTPAGGCCLWSSTASCSSVCCTRSPCPVNWDTDRVPETGTRQSTGGCLSCGAAPPPPVGRARGPGAVVNRSMHADGSMT